MNLQPLFETQRELDAKILLSKGLVGHDLLDKKILALQVELGELANEWRGFKFCSEDQEPNSTGYIKCDVCVDQPGKHEIYDEEGGIISADCPKCDGYEEVYVGDRLLEEYVDCFHFILSIGNDLNIDSIEFYGINNQKNVVDGFIRIYKSIVDLTINIDLNRHEGKWLEYSALFNNFIRQGELLGFTWNEVEQAYYQKNEINHERQVNGY